MSHLKIAIETVTRCPGNCDGCILARDERRAGASADFDPSNHVRLEGFLRSLAARFAAPDDPAADAGAVHLVQGDHLLLDPDALARLLVRLSDIVGARFPILISASMIGRAERVAAAADSLKQTADRLGQPCHLLLVFDPAKAFGPDYERIYAKNVAHAAARFGYVEPIINLGPEVPALARPRDLARFMAHHGFDEADLGLFPTLARAADYARTWPALVAWVREALALAEGEGRFTLSFIHLIRTIDAEVRDLDLPAFAAWLASRLRDQVYVDGDGALNGLMTGSLGNVIPLTERFGFAPLARCAESPEATSAAWTDSTVTLARRILASYLRTPACAECPHMKTCAAAGAFAWKRALAGYDVATPDCPIGIRGLFDDLMSGAPPRS